MQAKQQDGDSVTIPFLADYQTNKYDSCDPEKSTNDHSVPGKTSFFKTIFNGLNALSGVGILSVPYALSSGGWLSLVLLLIIAITTLYTGLLIERSMEVDPTIRSYPDVGDKAFGKIGRIIVSLFVNLELYMVAIAFLISVGDNLHNLLPNVEVNINGIIIGGRQTFVLLVALVVMPTVLINNMSTLSYVSATGVVASIIILGSVLWSGISDDIGFHQKGELLNWSGLPTALSLYAFCYCAHTVFPTLYTSMRNRTQFSWVLSICFLLSTLAYASMAILGYLMFGSGLQSQITLNLPTNKLSSRVAIYTALINPVAKYPLALKPIVDAIESKFKSPCRKRFYSLFIRSMLVGSTVLIALTIPFFGDLMSLVGAFLSVTASVLLPCVCYLKISGAYRRLGFELAINCFIILVGMIVLVVGTYTSLVEIIQNMMSSA